jgi:hypothetical protein
MEKFICKSLEEIEKVKIDLNKILKQKKKLHHFHLIQMI